MNDGRVDRFIFPIFSLFRFSFHSVINHFFIYLLMASVPFSIPSFKLIEFFIYISFSLHPLNLQILLTFSFLSIYSVRSFYDHSFSSAHFSVLYLHSKIKKMHFKDGMFYYETLDDRCQQTLISSVVNRLGCHLKHVYSRKNVYSSIAEMKKKHSKTLIL